MVPESFLFRIKALIRCLQSLTNFSSISFWCFSVCGIYLTQLDPCPVWIPLCFPLQNKLLLEGGRGYRMVRPVQSPKSDWTSQRKSLLVGFIVLTSKFPGKWNAAVALLCETTWHLHSNQEGNRADRAATPFMAFCHCKEFDKFQRCSKVGIRTKNISQESTDCFRNK